MKIRVSIGVCVRNCAKDIGQVVDRIAGQDFPHQNMEVIFVDDGSQDNTLSKIHQIAQRMNIPYKVFNHAWKGLGYSRNVVLKNSEGDFIVWFDDGTLFHKDYVRILANFMEKNANVGIATGFITAYTGSNQVAALENMGRLVPRKNRVGATTQLLGTGGSIHRVKAARQVGGFNEFIRGAGEDTDIAHRMLLAGWQMYLVNAELSCYYREKVQKVWKKSFWYGYGSHFLVHRHAEFRDMPYKSTPLAGFLEGVLTFSSLYKLTHKKIAFLLPAYYFSKNIFWCFGFSKGHLDSYGHGE